jgi:hypothetical protein
MRPVALLLLLALFASCATTKGRADELYDEGRFLEAAELYDQLAREHPDDVEVKVRRTRARNGALRVQLAYVTKVRLAGHRELAAQQLQKLFVLRDQWRMTTEPAIAKLLETELVEAGNWLESVVANRVRTSGPLVGESIALQYQALFANPELDKWRASIGTAIQAAARDMCGRLAPTTITPYWSWIANRYCTHFGIRAVEPMRLPNLRAGLAVTGNVQGTATGEVERIRIALANAFRASVWFSTDGATPVRASLSGSIGTSYDSRSVTRTADYTEQVPYTDHETVQEAYEEPYTDTEYYTEQVPHTEYRSESYDCGTSTCTRSVPETVYRSESRTRTVTKYRTQYRSVTRPVTRYRTEHRTYTYAGVEHYGRYTSNIRLVLGSEMEGLIAQVDQNATESGFETDASFPQASVYPQTANLTSPEGFVAIEERRLVAELVARLAGLYAARYCRSSQFTLEEAARCAYLDHQNAPPMVRKMLQEQFGEDEPLLSTLLSRS